MSLASKTVAAAASGNCALVGADFRIAATSELLGRTGANVALEAVTVFDDCFVAVICFLAASALVKTSRENAHEAINILTFVT